MLYDELSAMENLRYFSRLQPAGSHLRLHRIAGDGIARGWP